MSKKKIEAFCDFELFQQTKPLNHVKLGSRLPDFHYFIEKHLLIHVVSRKNSFRPPLLPRGLFSLHRTTSSLAIFLNKSYNFDTICPCLAIFFAAMIISDLLKQFYNTDRTPHIYFWGDKLHEVDCIIEQADRLFPVEIKSGQTISSSYFSGLTHWNNLAEANPSHGYVIYAGDTGSTRSAGNVIGWRQAETLVDKIHKI